MRVREPPHGDVGREHRRRSSRSRGETRTSSPPTATRGRPAPGSGGVFAEEVVPVEVPQRKGPPVVVEKDEHIRPDTTVEKLAALRPAFRPDGTVTAGNASGINDGAAAVVVMSRDRAEALGKKPLAAHPRLRLGGSRAPDHGHGPGARHPQGAGEGRPGGEGHRPHRGQRGLRRRRRWPSAASWASTGSARTSTAAAVAIGHPIGASGARILTTLLYEMKRREAQRGLATLCIGGGMGIAMIVEAVA